MADMKDHHHMDGEMDMDGHHQGIIMISTTGVVHKGVITDLHIVVVALPEVVVMHDDHLSKYYTINLISWGFTY